MKKKTTFITCAFALFIFFVNQSFAQVEIDKPLHMTGTFPNNVVTGVGSLGIGIGVVTPSAQLHTTGSVRFAGLTAATLNDVVVIDATGNLSKRTLSNIAFTGTETDPEVGALTLNFIPRWNGSMLVDGSMYDNGNIGIGTTAPASKLHVYDAANSRITVSRAGSPGAHSVWQYNAGIMDFGTLGGDGLSLITSGTSKIFASSASTGFVGIGTTAPVSKLDVNEGVLTLSGGVSNPHGILLDRGSVVPVSSGTQSSIFQEWNGIAGSSECLTLRSDNFKFQNFDGADEVIIRGGLVGIRTLTPAHHLQVGQHVAGDNADYTVGLLRHGTAASPGTYTANSPVLMINDFSNDGPGGLEATGLLYIVAGRIGDTDPNAGNANLLSTQNDNGHALTVKANRTVGIGTNSSLTRLHVSGNSTSPFTGGNRGLVTLDAPFVNGTFQAIDFLSSPGAVPACRIAAQMNTFGSLLVFGTSINYSTGITNSALVIDHTGNVGVGFSPVALTHKLHVNGNVGALGFINTSDAKFKKNVTLLENALGKITQLKGVSYNWKKEEFPELNFDDRKQIGFVAQDVEKVIPEAVYVDANGDYGVNYSAMVPLLVEAVKSQQQQIDELKAQNNLLMEKLERMGTGK